MVEQYGLTDEQLAKKKKWRKIWDKVTDVLLVGVFAAPIFVIAYIFIWFVTR